MSESKPCPMCLGTGIANEFGDQVSKFRAEHKVSRYKFAEYAGLSIATVRNVEMGSFAPRRETINRIVAGMDKIKSLENAESNLPQSVIDAHGQVEPPKTIAYYSSENDEEPF